MNTRARVLILTNRGDITADCVVLELQKREIDYFRFNVEDFPQSVAGTFSLGDGGGSLSFETLRGAVHLDEVSSIWYRRPGHPAIASEVADKGIREFCLKECEEFLEGAWENFEGLWVSFPPAIFRAQNKLYQLRLAREIGFKVPETVVTNDPDAVRRFIDRTRSGVVVKAVRQGALCVGGVEHAIFTSVIRNRDLEALADVSYAPSIFQRLVKKRVDLRVTVIGNLVHAVEIHTDPADTKGQLDWRGGDQDKLRYEIHELPADMVALCRTTVKRMGLNFGAIDLVLSENAEYYFLEINPNGQWAWIEQETGLRLTESLVDLLAGEQA